MPTLDACECFCNCIKQAFEDFSDTSQLQPIVWLYVVKVLKPTSFHRKKPQTVKNTENVEVNRPPDKDNATVMSYSRLSLESEAAAAAANSLPNNGAIRHHPNGLVTFSPPQGHVQPLYANTNGLNGYRSNGTVSVAIRSNQQTTRFTNMNNNNNNNNHSNNHNGNVPLVQGVQLQTHNV